MAAPRKTTPRKKQAVANKRATAPGRPPSYNLKLAHEICRRISEGELLMDICSEKGMPTAATVRGWDLDDRCGVATFAQGFSAMHARAVELRTEHELDELKKISTTPIVGKIVTHKQHVTKDGDVIDLEEVQYKDAVDRSKLAADTLKWRIATMQPGKYGPKADAKSGDNNDEPAKLIIEGGLPES